MKIKSNFEKSPHIEAIFDYVLEWLSVNDILMPIYLHPYNNAQFVYDLKKHPAFRRRKTSIAKMLSMVT